MFTAFTKLEEILKKRFMETCLLAQTKLVEIYSLTLMKLIEIRSAEINCNDKFQYISINFAPNFVWSIFRSRSEHISLAKQVYFTRRVYFVPTIRRDIFHLRSKYISRSEAEYISYVLPSYLSFK